MEKNTARGHLAALLTIAIWGTTFISTKVLLEDFQPVEILFIRFLMGYLALWITCPRRLRGVTGRQEGLFALAGLCGVCLYYLLENIALTYTMASNVGVIISVSPCFTALLTHFLMRGEDRLRPTFFEGFAVAMAGICLISFNGSALALDLRGDLLALLAAFVWACYALLTRRIGALGCPTVLTTRRTFFYGLVFMLPALAFSGARPDLARLLDPVDLGNLLFLGLGASALCFVTWNVAVRELGARFDRVVCAGGDGTLSEVAGGLLSLILRLGLLAACRLLLGLLRRLFLRSLLKRFIIPLGGGSFDRTQVIGGNRRLNRCHCFRIPGCRSHLVNRR